MATRMAQGQQVRTRGDHDAVIEPDGRGSGPSVHVAGRGLRGVEAAWVLATMVLAAALAIVPVVFASRFYFADDTQAGAWPIWVTIGEEIRAGRLPFFYPEHWMAGNIPAEGQWGLFNPVIWLIGLLASSGLDALVVVTAVKVTFLALAAGGTMLLARSYGASRGWGLAVGLAVTGTGFTTWMDSASWVTGLFVWALLPWTWWGLRVAGRLRGNPLLAIIPGFVLITVGYVHGTLLLVVTIVGLLLESWLVRERAAAVRIFGLGAVLGFVALATYLPGVLASPLTSRDEMSISNNNLMSVDLSALVGSASPTGLSWLTGFWRMPAQAPLVYISFLVVGFVAVRWSQVRPLMRSLTALLVVAAMSLAYVLGPTELGPLRFPARLLPYVSLTVLVLLAVLLTRAPRPLTWRLALGLTLVSAISSYFAFAEDPQVVRVAMGAFVGLVALLLVMWAAGRGRSTDAWIAAAATLGVVVVASVQHWQYPQSPLPEYEMPTTVADYRDLLADAPGDAAVVGNPPHTGRLWGTTSYANGFLLTDTPVINVYTPIMHRAYAQDLSANSHGAMQWPAAERLFSEDERTGALVADLLSLSAVQVLSRPDWDGGLDAAQDPYTYATTPEGWTEVSRDDVAALWVREDPVPGAGGIVHSDVGMALTDIEVSDREVSFTASAVPEGGGQVVMSRLDWPGYQVSNATLVESTRGYLLTVEVSPEQVGERVTVSFTPAGWDISLLSIGAAGVLTLLWAVLEPLARRRSDQRRAAVATAGAPAVAAEGTSTTVTPGGSESHLAPPSQRETGISSILVAETTTREERPGGNTPGGAARAETRPGGARAGEAETGEAETGGAGSAETPPKAGEDR